MLSVLLSERAKRPSRAAPQIQPGQVIGGDGGELNSPSRELPSGMCYGRSQWLGLAGRSPLTRGWPASLDGLSRLRSRPTRAEHPGYMSLRRSPPGVDFGERRR